MHKQNTKGIEIIIVDDHAIFRKGLRSILNRMEDITVIAEAENGRDFIKLLAIHNPDLVFMDVRMPVMDGIEATRSGLKIQPGLKILALSMFGEEEYLQDMIEAGVAGFLLKNVRKAEFQLAIKRILEGKNYYSMELIPFFTNKFIAKAKRNVSESHFTPRELEILQYIAKGLTSQEIADALFISRRTVEGHKANLIEKTGSNNILNLLIYAIKHDLVKL
ncbi:MAG: DNA-binding response regulator [Bacteroidetes bacterium]|nr:MAG: DNA-binding response regulator [Bacteroidota bacterium]